MDIANQFIAGLSMDLDTDLIRHGPGGDEQGGLFTKQFRDAFFEAAHSRVFAEDIVADLSSSHGSSHAWCGAGYSVTAQVYHCVAWGHSGSLSRHHSNILVGYRFLTISIGTRYVDGGVFCRSKGPI
jgi:hypothetical protein